MNRLEPLQQPIFKMRGPLDPVNDTAIYVPRRELDQLLRAAQAPTIDAYLAILSSRQTGKTTVLYQMRHRLRARGYGIALVDLSMVRDQPEEQLYRFVAGGVRSELEPNLPRLAERRDAVLPTNPLDFRQFMLKLARQVRTQRIVVLMDEVETVPENLADSFFGTIRNIFSSRRKEDEAAFAKYLFVLSGGKELHRLSTGPNSPLNIADRIYLQDLEVAGVQLLVANFQRAGIQAPAATAQWVFDQTGGHPYLTQKLCSIIEHSRPPSITPEIVRHAADVILRGDDHLEKMLSQFERETAMRELLQKIVTGQAMAFSRLNPTIARLELVGAIRDDGQCVIRNEIYRKAIEASLKPAQPKPAQRALPWNRILVAVLAILVLAINLPFLFNYTNDVLRAPRSVNDTLGVTDLGAHVIIRYDSVVRASDSTPSTIVVDVDQLVQPIVVTFRTDEPDIVRDGEAQRAFDRGGQQGRFGFFLHETALPYNPFEPATQHRRINLIFEDANGSKPSQTYTADFRVDYYSIAIASLVATLGSIVAFLASLWVNMERLRKAATFVGRFGSSNPEEE